MNTTTILTQGDSADTSIVAGTTFSGFISYDETLPDMSALDWYGNYYPNNPTLNSISVSVGNTNVTKEVNRIVVYDDKETCYGDPDCHYLDRFFLNAGDNVSPVRDFIQIQFDEQSFGVPKPTLLLSDNLPISPLNLDLSHIDVLLINTPGLIIHGTINALTTPVPEPSTLALLSIGLAGLGFTRRRMKT